MQSGEALSGTLNTIHNLAYYLEIMERVRRSLAAGGGVDGMSLSAN
jgi:queuine tRNA-ribosyltransferase